MFEKTTKFINETPVGLLEEDLRSCGVKFIENPKIKATLEVRPYPNMAVVYDYCIAVKLTFKYGSDAAELLAKLMIEGFNIKVNQNNNKEYELQFNIEGE